MAHSDEQTTNFVTMIYRYIIDYWYYLIFITSNGVMVIVAGYGHGDTSSNPGPDWLHFT